MSQARNMKPSSAKNVTATIFRFWTFFLDELKSGEVAGQYYTSLLNWSRKRKKIHRIYNEFRKPNFPREIQASKLEEASATKLP